MRRHLQETGESASVGVVARRAHRDTRRRRRGRAARAGVDAHDDRPRDRPGGPGGLARPHGRVPGARPRARRTPGGRTTDATRVVPALFEADPAGWRHTGRVPGAPSSPPPRRRRGCCRCAPKTVSAPGRLRGDGRGHRGRIRDHAGGAGRRRARRRGRPPAARASAALRWSGISRPRSRATARPNLHRRRQSGQPAERASPDRRGRGLDIHAGRSGVRPTGRSSPAPQAACTPRSSTPAPPRPAARTRPSQPPPRACWSRSSPPSTRTWLASPARGASRPEALRGSSAGSRVPAAR